jgi:hypothetical protein
MKRFAVAAIMLMAASSVAASTELGSDETQFTVNGKPTFLLGISYYGALGASKEFILRDLDDMQRYGFNWFRMWSTWAAFENNVSAVEAGGGARGEYIGKLQWLLAECDRRGIVVDVTISRGNGITGSPRLQSREESVRAAETLVTSLKSYRNWYLDMGNERNIQDKRFVSFEDLAEVRKAVKQLDPKRMVTASHAGDIPKNELRRYLLEVQVDFISPHRPRHARSPRETAEQSKTYAAWMTEIGRTVPLHYQEPFRRGFSPGQWEPKAEDFLTDLREAREGAAAGWCLHNGDQKDRPNSMPRRSFDMRERRLFDQLDKEEMTFIRDMKAANPE